MKVIVKRPNGSIRVFTRNNEPSMVDESYADEADANYIMDKFNKTGQISHLSKKQGVYADVSEMGDLLESSIQIDIAKKAFYDLPSELRKKLNNDPFNLPHWLNDPKNDDEAILYGLKEYKAGQVKPGSKPTAGEKTKIKKQKQTEPTNDDELNDDE